MNAPCRMRKNDGCVTRLHRKHIGIGVPAKDFGVLKQKFSGALNSPERQT